MRAGPVSCEKLGRLLSEPEGTTLEFKLKYQLSDRRNKAEVAKDILALANAGGRHAEDYAYLIIGAGNKLNSDGTRTREDVRPYAYTAEQFLQIVNACGTPDLAEFQYQEVELDGNYYGVMVIGPSRHVHYLKT